MATLQNSINQANCNGVSGANLILGYCAGNASVTGNYNTILGTYAGTNLNSSATYNLMLGYYAGNAPTTQSNNIYLMNAGAAESNTIRIGAEGSGNGQQNICFIAGISNATLATPTGFVEIDANGQLGRAAAAPIFVWSTQTAATVTAAIGNGYVTNRATLVTVNLPANFAVGDTIEVINIGAGFFSVVANGTDLIHFAGSTTSAGGSLTALEQYDALTLTGVVANTEWAVSSATGNYMVA